MRNQLLVAALALAVASSIGQAASLTINGSEAAYDNLSNMWLCTIPQSLFGSSLEATVTFDDAWSDVAINDMDVTSGESVTFKKVNGGKQYPISYTTSDGNYVSGYITFTYLPIVQLTGDFDLEAHDATLTITNPQSQQVQTISAQVAWYESSSSTAKCHYAITTTDGSHALLGLRNSTNWILEAGAIDMLRVRNKVAAELWLDMASDPCYIDEAPTAINGSRGQMVEVILNGNYHGIYNLCEPIDQQQLALKSYDDTMHGQLWNVSSWSRTATMSAPTTPDNNSSTWDGISVVYPDFDEVNPTDWSNLYDASVYVSNIEDTTQEMVSTIGQYFDLPVVMDYYIFLQSLLIVNNASHHFYWAAYDKQGDHRLTIVPWGMRASVGQDISLSYSRPTVISPTRTNWIDQVLLLALAMAPSSWQQICDRYNQLRLTVLSTDSLIARYQSAVDELKGCGAADRESQRWSGSTDIAGKTIDFDSEMEYISDWITRRMNHLDRNFFTDTPVGLEGDVNSDGLVTIADVNVIINIMLGAETDEFTQTRADVNNDGTITLADINAVINIMLE